jgi:tubulin---tyrosine ligase
VRHRSSGIPNSEFQSLAPSSSSKLYAIIDHPDLYVQPLIVSALKSQLQGLAVELIKSIQQLPSPDTRVLQFTDYDSLDFKHAVNHPRSSLICDYMIRKALIRKHYLSNTISTWLVKHPESPLKRHFRSAVHFELDYAEFLDEALVDAWDLNESMGRNEALGYDTNGTEWWILKPGMSDGGNGIRLFRTIQQLQSIFEEWDEDEDEDEDEDNAQRPIAGRGHDSRAPNGIMTSQLRHFIAQPYIDPPLLLPTRGNRKFHLRVYVLAVGALSVYVYKEMLALFAADSYQSPYHPHNDTTAELARHLTNTCLQDESTRAESVARFWDLEEADLEPDWKDRVFMQICEVTGEVFEAAAREQIVHFQALPNAFEIFGVDFLVDAELTVWLLELNACPDFKQTGKHLQDVIVGGLFREVVKIAIRPFFTQDEEEHESRGSSEMLPVRRIDLGRQY